EIAVVARGSCFYRANVLELHGCGVSSQSTNGMHVFGSDLAYKQGAYLDFLQVMGVLGNSTDQNQRPALLIQAVRNDRSERKTRHGLGVGRQDSTVFLEKQFSGILGRFNAQFMTPYIESVEKTDRRLVIVPARHRGSSRVQPGVIR